MTGAWASTNRFKSVGSSNTAAPSRPVSGLLAAVLPCPMLGQHLVHLHTARRLLWQDCAGPQQCFDRPGVIASLAIPTVLRAVDSPAQRRSAVVRVAEF